MFALQLFHRVHYGIAASHYILRKAIHSA